MLIILLHKINKRSNKEEKESGISNCSRHHFLQLAFMAAATSAGGLREAVLQHLVYPLYPLCLQYAAASHTAGVTEGGTWKRLLACFASLAGPVIRALHFIDTLWSVNLLKMCVCYGQNCTYICHTVGYVSLMKS